MTEAQRAHLHLLENYPRERIHTHESAPVQHLVLRSRAQVANWRKAWIKSNASILTRKEMATRLNTSTTWIAKMLCKLGLKAKRCERKSNASRRRRWIKAHAGKMTCREMAEALEITNQGVIHHLRALGIKCRSR